MPDGLVMAVATKDVNTEANRRNAREEKESRVGCVVTDEEEPSVTAENAAPGAANDEEAELCLASITAAFRRIQSSDFVVRTPLWKDCNKRFLRLAAAVPTLPDLRSFRLHLKLENTQITGSFKIRGVVNQMLAAAPGLRSSGSAPVTMSAGNYGKAFAHSLSSLEGIEAGLVVMPTIAPQDRVDLIRSMGCRVEQVPVSDLQSTVTSRVEESGMTFLHSFDDADLMAGHASLGLEILDDGCRPDIVLVCCGGGGLLAGVAAAFKLTEEVEGQKEMTEMNDGAGRTKSGNESIPAASKKCRTSIYGVEPEGAPTMYESFRRGAAFSFPDARSVASGLSPPYAGSRCYAECRKYVADILLVSDDDLREATALLYAAGVVAEPAGAAGFAALLKGKIPESLEGKEVCCVVTGANVSPGQMAEIADTVKLTLV